MVWSCHERGGDRGEDGIGGGDEGGAVGGEVGGGREDGDGEGIVGAGVVLVMAMVVVCYGLCLLWGVTI